MGGESLIAQRRYEDILATGEHGPAKDVKPSDLFRALSDVEPPNEVVPFPRLGADGKPVFDFRMRVLTQREIDSATLNAERYAARLLKEDYGLGREDVRDMRKEAWQEIFDNARLVELLFVACRDMDDVRRPLFDTPATMRRLLTADELAALFHTYTTLQFRFGPQWRLLDDAEVESWISRLEEGADFYPLAALGPGLQAQLLVSMAFRLRDLKQDTGSSGLPSGGGGSDTSAKSSDE